MSVQITKELLLKYEKPGPRYTSYPTAPEWSADVTEAIYQDKLTDFSLSNRTLSLYVHIPFCRTLCSFCGCNVVIRPHDEKHGNQYLDYLFRELELVEQWIGRKRKIKQFHWGGGTPTFLTEGQIERLFKRYTEVFDIDFNGEIAIEIDPRTIDRSKVAKLRELGFNRVSMGVQDFDAQVQESVNRRQPFEIVKEFYDWCRELKFNSVNFDLIYGLPYQTPETMKKTVEQVLALRPDRIAFYSFAYVPWLKAHQSKIDESRLPSSDQKVEIFLNSREQLLKGGYDAIAMDHFALADDELAKSFRAGTLYRNFMGYTVKPADEYIGMGMTSIGFLENCYFQNHKTLPDYFAALDRNEIPIERGKILSEDDIIRRWVINSLMCQFKADKNAFAQQFGKKFDEYFRDEAAHLNQCVSDGLIAVDGNVICATELGKIFIRNVCMGFDWYLRQADGHKRFSKTI